MAVNEIKAIGDVVDQLDADAEKESLKTEVITEVEQLDKALTVPNSELVKAVEVAKQELGKTSVSGNLDAADVLKALQEATGETTPGVETQWLAQQLGLNLTKLSANTGKLTGEDFKKETATSTETESR